MKLGEAMYKAQADQAAAGAAGPGAAGGGSAKEGDKDSTVVDADFEEVKDDKKDRSA